MAKLMTEMKNVGGWHKDKECRQSIMLGKIRGALDTKVSSLLVMYYKIENMYMVLE